MKEAVLTLLLTTFSNVAFTFRTSNYPTFPYAMRLRSAQTWQEDLDQILNVDTPCDSRRSLSKELFQKLSDISSDVISAIQDQDVEKVAPKSLSYGKAVRGIQAFNNQLVSDIIPEFLTKAVPRLVDEGPKLISQLVEKGPNELVESGQKAITAVREIAQDPSALQYTVDTLRREVRNIVKSTPEGLETPFYEVLRKSEDFELRRYEGYAVCSAAVCVSDSTEVIVTEPLATSASFQKLASYFFGENSQDGGSANIAMTAPVILDSKQMSFVLPRQYNAMTAPIPLSSDVELRDVTGTEVAAREFSGVVTEGEVMRQKAKLEDALLAQNINYDPSSFQVLQYNPPYALPWVRKNEIMVRVQLEAGQEEQRTVTEDTSKFFTAPEAGD